MTYALLHLPLNKFNFDCVFPILSIGMKNPHILVIYFLELSDLSNLFFSDRPSRSSCECLCRVEGRGRFSPGNALGEL